ncbi:SHREC complex subunit Mit1 [Schizosaccharomyces octosporus yFS286]|uniref:SHREC complex subunit Mit1 n=1 Tax=Schizosaccharomyces octosporus (strain yFS286) TaxID=483514 RepID=S9PZ04_SCHOY|nr:SHREC complex subunit Mit1 [Schizosaccharomyces octosporus yFS286]EPX74321.1 SHREC complex subunit Mit1 [Schizosaccharomyces octosporus yFS286]
MDVKIKQSMPKDVGFAKEVRIPRKPLEFLLPFYNPDETTVVKVLKEHGNHLYVAFLAGLKTTLHRKDISLYKNGKICYQKYLKRKRRIVDDDSDYDVNSYNGMKQDSSPTKQEPTNPVRNPSRTFRRSSSKGQSSQGKDLFASSLPNAETVFRNNEHDRKRIHQSNKKNKLELFEKISSNEDSDTLFQIPNNLDDAALSQSPVKPIPLILNAFAKFTHTSLCVKCHHHESKGDDRKFIYCRTCTNTFHVECSGISTLTKMRQAEISVEGYSCSSCSKSSVHVLLNNCILSGYGLNDSLDIPSSFSSTNDNLRLVSYTKDVRFRCWRCRRVFYFFYYDQNPDTFASSIQKLLRRRLCEECVSYPEDVDEILAWRLLLPISLLKGKPVKNPLSLDRPGIWSREYYVRPKNHSYLHCFWCSASWLASVSNTKKRNFDSRETDPHNGSLEIIPSSHITIDKVWNVRYRNSRKFGSKEKQLQALTNVEKAYVSWRGLPYLMSSWESITDIHGLNQWKAWKEGYTEYVRICWIEKYPKSSLIENTDFNQLELIEQPSYISGGKLMPYQIQGVNWLYFQWIQRQHCILADEMGLGKTVQVISFISVLYHRHHCFPFLIVVPHATVANWEREFHKWDPSLLVATLVGSERNREVVREHRIYQNGNFDSIRTHVLIISTSSVDSEISLLKKFRWQCMIIDEGQRLKSDQSSLFNDLISIEATFKALLTGTPLQNNIRELFNLLQFLTPDKIDASELEREYEHIDEEKVIELHQMLKPFFLRRVKEEVLERLPPKVEVIVPLTMTPLQKKLYKLIVSKNVDLIQSIVSKSRAKSNSNSSRASLSNILMQLRKTLAHPYLYSPDVEEKDVSEELSIRSLEEASAKMLLLRLLIPKLIMRGHRILLFSQFVQQLDILEDWMDHKDISYSRFDGTTTEHDRQKEIDSFNSPNSKKSCFLLTTRAGGVGINLASADTVIILDPDFNPHQDMQAIARAHRYGQDKKVLVFSLIIRNSAEEKILQAAQKKMLLDQIVVQSMGENNDNVMDLHDVLQHGVRALFEDNDDIQAIRYDEQSVEELITDAEQRDVSPNRRSDSNNNRTFGFTRVWVNNQEKSAALENDSLNKSEGPIQDDDIWLDILRQREQVASNSSFSNDDGRKLRQRKTIVYEEGEFLISSDEEYNADNVSSDGSSYDIMMNTPEQAEKQINNKERYVPLPVTETNQGELFEERFPYEWSRMRALLAEYPSQEIHDLDACTRLKAASNPMIFNDLNQRAIWKPQYVRSFQKDDSLFAHKNLLVANRIPKFVFDNFLATFFDDKSIACKCCGIEHVPGRCPLNKVPLEICFLCGTPHFSGKDTCPLLRDTTTVKILRNLLANSREPLPTKLLALERLNGYLYKNGGSSS